MNSLRLLLLPLILIRAPDSMVLDTAWTRILGPGYGRMVLPMPDSGYILSDDRSVYRLDGRGETLWKHDFAANSIALRGKSGVAAVGVYSFILLDEKGRETFRRPMTGMSMIGTATGGFLVSSLDTAFQTILVHLDSNGAEIRSLTVTGTCSGFLAPASGGGYLLAGYTNTVRQNCLADPPYTLEQIMVRLDSMLQVKSRTTWRYPDGLRGQNIRAMIELPDSNWAMYGQAYSSSAGSSITAFLNINQGTIRKYSNSCSDCPKSRAGNAFREEDGGYLLSGQKGNESWIAKTDPMGTVVWQSSFAGKNRNETGATWISETSDSGYIMTGRYGNPAQTWVVKLNYYDSLHPVNIGNAQPGRTSRRIGITRGPGGMTEILVHGAPSDFQMLLTDIHGSKVARFSPAAAAGHPLGKAQWRFATPSRGLYFLRFSSPRESLSLKMVVE